MNLQSLINRPETVLYAFASDSFVKKLGNKAMVIVARKRANQRKLIADFAGGVSNSANALSRIRESFVSMYGMQPEDALHRLAAGEEVVGKNWAEGVYGIGSIKRTTFNQNANVTVDSKTGQILVGGTAVEGQSSIYSGKTVKSYAYTDANGNTYTSVKRGGQYYANTYTAAGAESSQNANGDPVSGADSAGVWVSVAEMFRNFLEKLLELFGLGKKDTILDPNNTLPMQTDGFVEEETGIGEAAMWAVLAVGAGIMLSGGLKPKK